MKTSSVHVAHIIENFGGAVSCHPAGLAADKLMIVGARYQLDSGQSGSAELLSVRSAISPPAGFGESFWP